MVQPPNDWTPARIEQLRALLAQDLSMSEIGAEMGLSRNAVIGKASRLGLSRSAPNRPAADEETRRKKHAESERNRRRSGRVKRRGAKKMQHSVITYTPPAEEPSAPAFTVYLNIPFADLRDFKNSEPNQCRYIPPENNAPVPYFYCGNETLPGESYCGHCQDIVYGRNQVQQNVSAHEAARRNAMFKKGGRLPTVLGVAGADIISDEAA